MEEREAYCNFILCVVGWFLILDEPVIIASVCVPDDVVQHDQSLKLKLEWSLQLRVDRLSLKLIQLHLSVSVTFHKSLEGANLH